MSIYVADFETTVRDDFACVWLSALINVDNTDEVYYQSSIEEFYEKLYEINPDIVFFHNLKFDGMYILDFLLRNGFSHSQERKPKPTEFTTLIGEQGEFYSLTFWGENKPIKVWDSLKIFNFSVDEIARSFNMDTLKGSIDYNAPRPYGYIPTDEEIKYVYHDVLIVAKAIKMFRDEGHVKMTVASNALSEFKSTINKKDFKYLFPKLQANVDAFCRRSYKGGFTYVNPKYQNKIITLGCVYDMNSMYPYTLYYKDMPVGTPHYFIGKPPNDKLYIIRVHCEKISVKENHIPTIQIKGSFRFVSTDYLTNAEDIDLYLTSVDYKLFLDHYNVVGLTEIEGYSFESRDDLFRVYIDKFMEQKRTSKGGKRQIAKLFLNGLYGKFGSKIEKISKVPYLDDESDVVKFKRMQPKQTEPLYIPIASFVTAYARDNIIRNAQECYDRFLYCDTDSLHLIGYDIPNIPIHDSELGYYKCEGKFIKARYIRAKTYVEQIMYQKKYVSIKCNHKVIVGKLRSCIFLDDIKCAGMSKSIVKSGVVNFDNFKAGTEYEGKLKPKAIRGGVVLEEIPFTIKEL